MNKFFIFVSINIILMLVLVSSCVSPRAVEDAKKETYRVRTQKDLLQKQYDSIAVLSSKMFNKNQELAKENKALKEDTLLLSQRFKKFAFNNGDLNKRLDETMTENERLRKENRELNNNFTQKETEIRDRAFEIKQREAELALKEKNMSYNQQQINDGKQNLAKQQQRFDNIDSLNNLKKMQLQAINSELNLNLSPYKASGLSIEQKNDKITLTFNDKLLFNTTNYQLTTNGKTALKQLENILENHPQLLINILGHTDDLPPAPKTAKTKLDLSLQKAATVAKQLSNNPRINKSTITTGGKADNEPLDNSKNALARSANRRVEIVLSIN